MKVSDFDYELPAQFIAQTPAVPRDSSRLLHLDRASGDIRHSRFSDIIQLLRSGDVLVLNNTRVIRARIRARKAETGGKAEILLLRKLDGWHWDALVRGRNIGPGMQLHIDGAKLSCAVLERFDHGKARLEFDQPIDALLDELGEIPLPPYIRESLTADAQYQTVYSEVRGLRRRRLPVSILLTSFSMLFERKASSWPSAPCTSAWTHFSRSLSKYVAEHNIHSEYINLGAGSAEIINRAKLQGGRVIAVGTTSARTLESAARGVQERKKYGSENLLASQADRIEAIEGFTDLFITPGYQWRIVDAMITNFHLPRSTLLMMLSSFVGRERLLDTYEIAKDKGYRFYSFGDAMFIT